MKQKYNHAFYVNRHKITKYAANKVLDILSEYITISSMADVGGGVGTWLKMAQEKFGVESENLLLIEGDYVEEGLLQISPKQWIPWNLENRFHVEGRFDMVVSLEVAEHLSSGRAKTFCEDLTALSDVVLFSAATPFQGGTGHINEQPLSYWVRLFKKFQYEAFDIIRPIIQKDGKIASFYRQNIVVFVKIDTPSYNQFVTKIRNLPPLDAICYDIYLEPERELHLLSFYNRYWRLKRKVEIKVEKFIQKIKK